MNGTCELRPRLEKTRRIIKSTVGPEEQYIWRYSAASGTDPDGAIRAVAT